MGKVYRSMTELVGRTPIVELSRLASKYKCKGRIFAKCEFFNPLFSVKDRIALRMIDAKQDKPESEKPLNRN